MRNNVLTTFPPALSLDFSIVYAKIRFDFDSFRISNENRTRTSYRSLSHHQPTKPPTNQTTNKPTTKPPSSDHNQNRKKKQTNSRKNKIENRKPIKNEKNQIMKSNVWLRLVWYDYQLQWDEADYGGIGVLRLPPDKVWKPDIVLFNK